MDDWPNHFFVQNNKHMNRMTQFNKVIYFGKSHYIVYEKESTLLLGKNKTLFIILNLKTDGNQQLNYQNVD